MADDRKTCRHLDQPAVRSGFGDEAEMEMFQLKVPDGIDPSHPGDQILLDTLLRDRKG